MREITQFELRNDSGAIMRGLDAGETFVVTRNGAAVGELIPLRGSRFVRKEQVADLFHRGARISYEGFRTDLDEYVDPDPAPRA